MIAACCGLSRGGGLVSILGCWVFGVVVYGLCGDCGVLYVCDYGLR